ncbi:MAG: FAD:protein FMN transferase [Verrucomicrobia bacterium]|nr:FAD:protein FMN transferase [Verrucomicrobiota bacterium]
MKQASFSVLLLVLLCAAPTAALALERYEFSRPQMGMRFQIVLYAADEKTAEEAANAAFRRIKEINAIMSDYEPDSELSRLSRTSGSGQAMPLGERLWFVLSRAQEFSRRSDGAFDVTVGPCVWLWRKARREHRLPDPATLAEAMKAVGYKNVQLDPKRRTAKLLVPKMRLDLGAIAKGYAVSEAVTVLRERGIASALVVGGGNMSMSDPPPGKAGWRIAIPTLNSPDTTEEKTRYVLLSRMALSTSGDFFQFLEIGGKHYSHIVNPHTGIGLTDHRQVVVIAPDGITADGLSTCVGVLGPKAGMEMITSTPGAEVLITQKPGDKVETFESPGFAKFYEKP